MRNQFASRYTIQELEPRRLLATVPAGFTETLIAGNLSTPTAMAFAPDGRLFLAQQTGEIKIIKNGAVLANNFAIVNEDSNAERGLLGLALDPNFASNNFVYVYYTAASPTSHNRLSRFVANGDVATGSEQVLLDLPDIGGAIWHMGGSIQFGFDGKLYISVGDHQNSSNSQSLNVPMGKVLRVNSDGTIPADNPFYNQTSGVNRAIWALGLRNPYTTTWHPTQNLFYLNDVGESSWEEINQGAAGANYGWPGTEGTFNQGSFPNFTNPIYAYSHGVGFCIIGGAFYAGSGTMTFPSQYQGMYFFADFVTGFMKYMDPTTKAVSNFATGLSYATGMRLAPDGSIWYISRGSESGGAGLAKVYRIQYTAGQAPTIATNPSSQTAAVGDNVTFIVSANGTSPFSYQWQRNQANISGATSASYTRTNVQSGDNNAKFRCIVTNAIGNATSSEATLAVTSNLRPVPTIVTPLATRTYGGGELIAYSGTATDNEDGPLSGSAFTWKVDLHHDTHSHPFVAPVTGSASGSFSIPTSGEVSPNVWYRITLTVIDSGGLTQTTTRDVQPRRANLTLATNVAGLALTLDGQPVTVGAPILGVEGVTRTFGAAATQTVGGVTYEFVGWSDGGAATHPASFPSADTRWTAYYRRAATTSTPVSDLNWTGSTNGWGPVEKDKSNGENGSNDGHTITLNGVTYGKGLGAHANSTVTYSLGGAYTRFMSDIGVDDEVGGGGSVIFQVFGEGTKIYDSGSMNGSTATKSIDLDITGVSSFQLVMTDAGNGNNMDHGDWANARLLRVASGGTTLNGTVGDDTFVMRLNPGGTLLQIWQNAPTSGDPTQTFPASAIGQMIVNGNDGDDTLVLDFSNGTFATADSITFNGGNGANDSIQFIGTTESEVMNLTGTHLFIGTLPVAFTTLENLRIESADGDDLLNINATAPATSFIGGSGLDRLIFNGGTSTISSDLGSFGDVVQLLVHNNAIVNLNASQHLAALTITGFGRAEVGAGGNKILRTGALSIGQASQLDLADADLILDYVGTSPLSTVQGLINTARNNGMWNGNGLTSTAAKNRTPKNTTIGAMPSSDYIEVTGNNIFAGESISNTALLLKYTYYGDADFNGTINFDDYARLDNGFNNNRIGWANGDFDGNGVVNFDDYSLIDMVFNTKDEVL